VPYSSVQVLAGDTSMAGGGRMIGDGGWVVDGGESFILRCEPGKPAVVLMRTFVPRPSAVRVSLNGGPAQEVRLAPVQGKFQSVLVWQDQGRAVKAVNSVRVECVREFGNEYSSFHYWVMQKAPGGE